MQDVTHSKLGHSGPVNMVQKTRHRLWTNNNSLHLIHFVYVLTHVGLPKWTPVAWITLCVKSFNTKDDQNTHFGLIKLRHGWLITSILFLWGVIIHSCHNFGGGLSHWGRVTHICVSKPTIIGSDNGLSPGRRQAIIWTNAGILLIGPIGLNVSENLIEIRTFLFMKMLWKMSSGKWRPFCLGINVLTNRRTTKLQI